MRNALGCWEGGVCGGCVFSLDIFFVDSMLWSNGFVFFFLMV